MVERVQREVKVATAAFSLRKAPPLPW